MKKEKQLRLHIFKIRTPGLAVIEIFKSLVTLTLPYLWGHCNHVGYSQWIGYIDFSQCVSPSMYIYI